MLGDALTALAQLVSKGPAARLVLSVTALARYRRGSLLDRDTGSEVVVVEGYVVLKARHGRCPFRRKSARSKKVFNVDIGAQRHRACTVLSWFTFRPRCRQ